MDISGVGANPVYVTLSALDRQERNLKTLPQESATQMNNQSRSADYRVTGSSRETQFEEVERGDRKQEITTTKEIVEKQRIDVWA